MACPEDRNDNSPPPIVHQQCPWCGKTHASSSYDINWYFVCCGTTRLVWRDVPGLGLELQPVEEDMNDE